MLIAIAGVITVRPTPADFGTIRSPGAGYPTSTPARQPSAAVKPGPIKTAAAVAAIPLPAPPATLSIPAMGVHAPVERVRTTNGSLAVPDDPTHVGWWIGGAMPGGLVGSVVIDGHVDSAVAGLGALFRLTELRGGDQIVLTTVRRQRVHYLVEARRVLSKSKPLPPDLFSASGPARLVVITCGGPFDRQTRSYEDNIVVIATPSD